MSATPLHLAEGTQWTACGVPRGSLCCTADRTVFRGVVEGRDPERSACPLCACALSEEGSAPLAITVPVEVMPIGMPDSKGGMRLFFRCVGFERKWSAGDTKGETFVPLQSIDLVVEVPGRYVIVKGEDLTRAALAMLGVEAGEPVTFEEPDPAARRRGMLFVAALLDAQRERVPGGS